MKPIAEKKGKPPFADIDFNKNPYIVIWETTRACDLACKHCRAEAVKKRHPDELTHQEVKSLLERVAEFGKPLFVLTGGDPLWRDDIYDIISYGDRLGLRMTMTPSGTPRMTQGVVKKCRDSGLVRMAVSLDGSTKEIHDGFRRVAGSFEWTVNILRYAHNIGLSTQVNTTITRFNIHDVEDIVKLMLTLGISMWSVFFLVPTGRGKPEDEISAEEYESVFNRMFELSKHAPFDIKSTAAPHYRRVVVQHQTADKKKESGGPRPSFLTGGIGFSLKDGIGRSTKSVNDGSGFVFISHTGEVYPSGFLPLSGGNIRDKSLPDIYRNSPLFKQLRDFSQLKGKCHDCEYRNICGGSRARAYGMMGDYMESDPFCVHIPKKYQRKMEQGSAEAPGIYFKKRIDAFTGLL